ncbi:hypothetical protein F7R21_22340 [Burkholderia latens]|uniref:Uncharacterized protein n=1 Tax=Burkholderia latens TaxID=488446 RepID=A0A6H9T927_9BURK|nr:hypothetical protein [Burkholderia latens]KAB0636713.1 hypothetical protein F7R21_22340 [Burkholderia latens]
MYHLNQKNEIGRRPNATAFDRPAVLRRYGGIVAATGNRLRAMPLRPSGSLARREAEKRT